MNTINLNTIGEAPVKKVAGGGASGGGGNYVYYRCSLDDIAELAVFASVVKISNKGTIEFNGLSYIYMANLDLNSVIAVGFDTNLRVTNYSTGEVTALGEFAIPILDNFGIPRITEEEFYKILPVFAIRFSDGTKNYTYEDGMTWGEWLNSEHSKGEFEFMDCGDFQGIKHIDTYGDVSEGPSLVKDSDLISNNKEYICLGAPA